jgi:hypothetical protein
MADPAVTRRGFVRAPRARWSAAVLGPLLVAAVAGAQSEPASVQDVTMEARQGAAVVVIKASGKPRHQVMLLGDPPRILIDLSNTRFAWPRSPLAGIADPVKEIRGSQYRPDMTRLVIELTRKSDYRIETSDEGVRVILGPAAVPARPDGTAGSRESAASTASVDPTRPLLYGVVYGPHGWVAYIQDPATKTVTAYRVGDALAGTTIEAIEEERVRLKGPDGTIELQLSDDKPGKVKRRR